MVARALRRATSVATVLLLLVASGSAAAEDITSQELADLVAEAGDDTESFDRLKNVTSVDGMPANVDTILDGSIQDTAIRLETLRQVLRGSTGSLDGSELRAEAAEITSKPPFAAAPATGSGPLDRVWRFLGSLFGSEGAQGIALLAIAIVALVVAVWVLRRLVNKSGRVPHIATAAAEKAKRDLYAEAQTAAAAGDHETAVRLLFLDGAEYLEAHQAVASAATTSTSTVRSIAQETKFLDRFDEIVYGGRIARDQDVSESDSAWLRLKRRFK